DDFEVDPDSSTADIEDQNVGFRAIDDEAVATEEEEEATAPVRREKIAEAKWGVLPTLVLLPCVLIMFVIGLMGFEMVRSMWGHETKKPVTAMVLNWMSTILPGENGKP